MRYHVLACDYDDTLATLGQVDEHTVKTLERVSRSGRKLLLVTGRELDDLLTVFPHTDLFDLVVAENGGAALRPRGSAAGTPLADAPPAEPSSSGYASQGATPLGVGRPVVVATREPYARAGARGDPGAGAGAAGGPQQGRRDGAAAGREQGSQGWPPRCVRLQMSRHNVVAVGDAENDHAFLTAAELRGRGRQRGAGPAGGSATCPPLGPRRGQGGRAASPRCCLSG